MKALLLGLSALGLLVPNNAMAQSDSMMGMVTNHYPSLDSPFKNDSNTVSKGISPLPILNTFCPLRINQESEWGMHVLGGFVLPHHSDMMAMYRHIGGLAIRYRAAMKEPNFSGNYFDKITHGYALNLLNLGSRVVGYGIGVSGMIMIQSGRHNYCLVGMGLGYLSQKFDALDNPRNVAIGSHYNGTMQLGYHWEFSHLLSVKAKYAKEKMSVERGASLNSIPIHHVWKLNAELGLIHFSNANWRQPNFGVNLPYLSFGIKRALVHSYYHLPNGFNKSGVQTTKIEDFDRVEVLGWKHPDTYQKQLLTNKNSFFLHALGLRFGRRQIELDQRKTFTNTVIEYMADHVNPSSTHHWRMGAVVFIDPSYRYTKFAQTKPLQYPNRPMDDLEIAISGGHKWVFGDWGIITDLGLYLYRPNSNKRRYFEAIGISYQASPHIQIVGRLKVHLSTADYMEWGLGYTL